MDVATGWEEHQGQRSLEPGGGGLKVSRATGTLFWGQKEGQDAAPALKVMERFSCVLGDKNAEHENHDCRALVPTGKAESVVMLARVDRRETRN